MDAFLNVIPFLAVLAGAITLCLHVLFAASIYLDATRLEAEGKTLYFVGPLAWSLVIIFLGLIAVYIYWIMHHSQLRKPIDPNY